MAGRGLALIWLSPRGLFLVAAIADLMSLLNVRFGIRDRPARGTPVRGTGDKRDERNVVRRTAAVNRRLLGSRLTRPLYLALWVPNGLIVGCESLFVPYGHGHGPLAGWLFGAGAAGMMLGDLTFGRFVPPARRDSLIEPLRFLLAAPYVVFLLSPPAYVAVALAFGASVGYAASLPLQDLLLRHADDEVQGQVMGLYGSGLMIGQAIGALIAGTVAAWTAPGRAVGVMAIMSVVVTFVLVPGLRRSGRSGELAEGLVDGSAG